MALPENENGQEQEGPVIRDKRRIDPETGELRTPEGESAPAADSQVPSEPEAGTADGAELATVREQLAERTDDLKRLQAEYANYRKRVDRDRTAVREQETARVVSELLPILDDIGRAREHNELNGGFKSVGEALEALATKLGLQKYGEKGDEFDPTVHEALTLVPSPDPEITVQSVIEVFQPGYLIGERVLRPARVVVADPIGDTAGTDTPQEAAQEATEEAAEEDPGAAPDESADSPEVGDDNEKQ
ncbi:MAG: nucleotide exchange factor GrpE [Nocardiopsaceae bacterium]|nr:nucleotide exchange factor GrpE [Nocardiopsaceae bacterium]